MLAIIIILTVLEIATAFLLWRSIRRERVYFRSYKMLSAELPALQARAAEITKSVKRGGGLVWLLAFCCVCLWLVGYRLACENDKLKKS